MKTDNSYPNPNPIDKQPVAPDEQPIKPAQTITYTVPTEIVELPSKGLYYPTNHPLSSGTIEIRSMTAKDEDILTTTSFIQQGVVLDKLLQSIIVTDFDYGTIMNGDKTAVLMAARVTAYGPEYDIEVTTPSGEVRKEQINLGEMDYKELDPEFIPKHENRFKVTLPQSRAVVEIKALTHADEKVVERSIKRLKKPNAPDPTMSTRLKQHILSVNGDGKFTAINNFVENGLSLRDSKALKGFIKRITPDVDTSLEFYDDDTNEPFRIDFPFNTSFFWPDS